MPGNEKIKALEDLAVLAASLRAHGKKVVQCHGVFDLLHVGAVRYLKQAKRLGDVLLVTLSPDESPGGHARPCFSAAQRAETVAAVAHVDYVSIERGPSCGEAIRLLRPDVYVPSDEESAHEGEPTSSRARAEAIVREVGGTVAMLDNAVLKPARLAQPASPAYPSEAAPFLASFVSRYSRHRVLDCLEQVRSLRVLFVGETIIDEYQYCETIGKSGKEPVLAARYLSEEKFAGGILASAGQAAVLADHVGMLTVLGSQESHEALIREKLNPQNYTVARTAEIVRDVVGRLMPQRGEIPLVTTPSDDPRSYHICSEKIKRELGFTPKRTVEDGVSDLVREFQVGRIPNPMTDIRYYNIRMMKAAQLK